MKIDEKLHEALIAAIKYAGTKAELARQSNVDPACITRWEKNKASLLTTKTGQNCVSLLSHLRYHLLASKYLTKYCDIA